MMLGRTAKRLTAAQQIAAMAPVAWYDPSDITTLFQDSAGTTPVTADGDPVGKMLDKSGNGLHVTQATATKRPLYKTTGGIPHLKFDGVDDFLSVNAAALRIVGDLTIIAASYQEPAGNPVPVIASCQTNAGTVNAYEFRYNPTNASMLFVHADGAAFDQIDSGALTFNPQTGFWAVLTSRRSVTVNVELSINKTRYNIASGRTPTADAGSTFVIGDRLATAAGNTPLLGRIGQLLLFNTRRNDADTGLVETYAGAKVGLTI